MRILANEKGILLLFIVAVLVVGVEAGSMGILPTFLAEVRGYGDTAAKLGLVAFLAGIAAGRLVIGFIVKLKAVLRYVAVLLALGLPCFTVLYFVDLGHWTYLVAFLAGTTLSALLPLILTFAGALFKEMAGTVLGTIKVAIPLGGIITPFTHGADRRERLDTSFPDHLPALPAGRFPAAVAGHAADERRREPNAS